MPTDRTASCVPVIAGYSGKAAAYSGEVDLELLTLVERYATNLARWDLLVFFGRNPSTRDDAREIARQIGRRPQCVAKELEDLAYLGILQAHQNESGMIYQLTRIPAMRRAVRRLAERFDRPRVPST